MQHKGGLEHPASTGGGSWKDNLSKRRLLLDLDNFQLLLRVLEHRRGNTLVLTLCKHNMVVTVRQW